MLKIAMFSLNRQFTIRFNLEIIKICIEVNKKGRKNLYQRKWARQNDRKD